MARSFRRSSSDLSALPEKKIIHDLCRQGHKYSFFQAIRLLRHLRRAQGEISDEQLESAIKIRPKISFAFPAADIDRIETIDSENDIDDDEKYQLTATFLGLYGSCSPLPNFYTEDLLTEQAEDENVSRDFLDIIHQRLFTLLYQGWQKYRLFFQVNEEKDSSNLERLYCLLGLPAAGLGGGDCFSVKLLRYIGLFTQFPRSALGLSTLLRDALKPTPVNIVPCIFRKAKIPEHQRLKTGVCNHCLGESTFLGEEIEDRMGMFRIQLGPLQQKDFLHYTPGNPGYNELVALTDIFINDPLAYEIELILAENQANTVCLGDKVTSALGVTTWVFSGQKMGEVRTRFLVNRELN
ncbi:MAG: type VI secretion system baseplate subunit TssG [Desulfobacteraceae bacterium]|nr:type VI secretion system baseplate subunit TssG [Desulfobacteraceae bacterium]